MRSTSLVRFAAALLPLAVLGSALAEAPHIVPEKISVVPPEGWAPRDPAEMAQAAKASARAMGMSRYVRGAPPLAVFLAAAETQGFRSNLNIREVEQVLTADDKAVAEYRARMAKELAALKPAVESVELVPVGKRTALRAEWTYQLGQVPLKVVQVALPGRGVTFIATYTVHASRFTAEKEAIDASIDTLRSLEPWYAWVVGRPIVLYSLIGAGVGLVVGLLAWFARR